MKLVFFRGGSIDDPKKLFNSSLEEKTRRAIDLREGEKMMRLRWKLRLNGAHRWLTPVEVVEAWLHDPVLALAWRSLLVAR